VSLGICDSELVFSVYTNSKTGFYKTTPLILQYCSLLGCVQIHCLAKLNITESFLLCTNSIRMTSN